VADYAGQVTAFSVAVTMSVRYSQLATDRLAAAV
jgi:hypothetical protein